VREAMSTVGPPVVFTTASLSLGFLAQALSGFVPIQQFAYFSALNVFTSLLADLFLTPAFVASVRFVTLWDLVTLKLGREPERTIPLFHGLRSSQARIALLFGQLRNVLEGERIVTQGDPGDEMFVLLSGSADVQVWGPQGAVTVATLARGAVVGEMGLLRNEARSADVVAVEPSEVLVVDQRFFPTLLQRYPKIASVLLLNLSRTLSEKVQSTTQRLVAASDVPRGTNERVVHGGFSSGT
jgi:CRP-like cAMP-binding protein